MKLVQMSEDEPGRFARSATGADCEPNLVLAHVLSNGHMVQGPGCYPRRRHDPEQDTGANRMVKENERVG